LWQLNNETKIDVFHVEKFGKFLFNCGTSNWKAAKNSAHKRTKLDETGIDVAGCRHALAVGAVNMSQGELFGYTHYLQVNRLVLQVLAMVYITTERSVSSRCLLYETSTFHHAWQRSCLVMSGTVKFQTNSEIN
jgi:hypothetical protein